MRRLIALLAAALLAGCGGPTTIARADLESALLQDGDLPAGWAAGQIRSTAPASWAPPDRFAGRELASGAVLGDVAVGVYADADAALAARAATSGEPHEGLGQWARAYPTGVAWVQGRCAAHVVMDRDAALAYAQRLDARLEALGC